MSTPEKLEELVVAGMNVARLNMSHGDYAEHLGRLTMTRHAAKTVGKQVGILADLQGPKIRLGRFSNGKEELTPGQTFTITTDDIQGDAERCSTTYKGLPGDVTVGERILIDDGKLALTVTDVTATDVVCEVVIGGPVSNNKGINIPAVAMSVPALTDKDERDLRWALSQDVDFIALSFVRHPDDITRVHEIMDEEGRRLPVIAKLEKPQAVQNLEGIIDAFDGVMVARGDLGVEVPLEEVPLVQKRIITAARKWAKPVIVATQMLESMIQAPRPTRAEASDVANAVLDGADAVMLSGETSVGAYPIQTVEIMSRIVENTEEHGFAAIRDIEWSPHSTGGVIAKVAAEAAARLNAKYLCAFTQSGDTARRLSRLRTSIPLLAFTPSEQTSRELTVVWGMTAVLTPAFDDYDAMTEFVNDYFLDAGLAGVGDVLMVVSGSPMGVAGNTNMLRAHHMVPRGAHVFIGHETSE